MYRSLVKYRSRPLGSRLGTGGTDGGSGAAKIISANVYSDRLVYVHLSDGGLRAGVGAESGEGSVGALKR